MSFEMFRVNAVNYFTKMFNFKSVRNFSFCQGIRKSIGCFLSGIKVHITFSHCPTNPEPTSFSLYNVTPKSFFDSHKFSVAESLLLVKELL